MVILPDCRKRLGDIEVAKMDGVVGRNLKLDVIARCKGDAFAMIQGFEHKLLDKGRHTRITNHSERAGFRCPGASSTRPQDIDMNHSAAFFYRVRRKSATDRGTRRRSVDEIEPAIMFGTFDGASEDQPLRQMSVSVGADSVSGVQAILDVPVDRKGFVQMVEPDYVSPAQVRGSAGLDPPVNIRHLERQGRIAPGAAARWRKLARDVIPGVFYLAENGGDDLAPRAQKTTIGGGTVILNELVQFGQRMVRHQGEHVMFDVIIHVPVKVPVQRIHVDGSGVETMVENVLGQAGVLREAVCNQKPRAEKIGQANE